MATPKLTPNQISEVSNLVAGYIVTQRHKYAARAAPLSAQQRALVAAFFSPELLGNTRVLVLESERVVNPEFYPNAVCNGLPEFARSVRNGSHHLPRRGRFT
jgi:hypothetical protein